MAKDYFSDVPEHLSIDEIRKEISDLVDGVGECARMSTAQVADALLEMIERQSNHYVPLDDDTRRRIQTWVTKQWSEGLPADLLDALATTMVNLGLAEGKSLLEAALGSSRPDMQKVARDALSEFQEW